MPGEIHSADFAGRHAGDIRRGFRKIGLFSRPETLEEHDLFSGGSDIELHEVPNAMASVELAELGAISIGRVRSTGHDVRVREPHALTLIVPLRGSVTVEDDFGRTTAHPGSALLVPVGKRVTRVQPSATSPFIGVPVLIPSLVLGDRLAVSGLDRAIRLDASRSSLHAGLTRLVTFLHDELRHGGGLLRRPSVEASHFEMIKEIIEDILSESTSSARNRAVDRSVMSRRVRAAEEYMRANMSEILTVADVARALGISVRSLELAFRSVRDVSPYRYLASLRLGMARSLLLSDPKITSVTDACFASGISHVGRFATTYRERFGESPSETLRRR